MVGPLRTALASPPVVRPPHRLHRRCRPGPVLVLVSVLASIVAAPAAAWAEEAPPGEPMVVIEGRGWGHGVGMAQDGALAMGREGASTADILQHFYPGTNVGQDSGNVRVAILDAPGGDAVISFPGGGEVRSSRSGPQEAGFPVRVAEGGSVRLRFDGSYRVEPLSGATVAALGVGEGAVLVPPSEVTVAQAPPGDAPEEDDGGILGGRLIGPGNPPPENLPLPPAPPPPGDAPVPAAPEPVPAAPGPSTTEPAPPENVAVSGSALWAVPDDGATVAVPARSARYRGVLHAIGGAGLRVVNELDVEEYLRGMGEVIDSSWPQASLGAQAVAARTYALRAMALGGELCDTQDCQVYLGAQAEYGAMNAAVAATRSQVVLHDGRLAQTVYSASGGGVTATPEEGFGTSGQGLPYLGPVSYPTADPQPWVQRIPLAQLGRRLSYPGNLTDVRISVTGPSGRAITVELTGDAGAREVPALAFDDKLGLRSTMWSLRMEAPPAPPGPGGTVGTFEPGAGWTWAADAGTSTGRSLISDHLPPAAVLAGLEGPLRAAAALTSVALLLGVGTGAMFRVIARRSPERPRPTGK